VGKPKQTRLRDIPWDDRCASYWAAYKKLDPETRAEVDGLACELRDRVKGDFNIQMSEAMAIAVLAETCVRSLFPHTQDPCIEEVVK
jgi:hypothetical protein